MSPLEASSQKPEDKEPIDTQRAPPPPRTQKSLEKVGEQIWEQRTENNQHRQDKEDDSAGDGQYNQAQFISSEQRDVSLISDVLECPQFLVGSP